jgi:hypothetical protein
MYWNPAESAKDFLLEYQKPILVLSQESKIKA